MLKNRQRATVQQLEEEKHELILKSVKKEAKLQELEEQNKNWQQQMKTGRATFSSWRRNTRNRRRNNLIMSKKKNPPTTRSKQCFHQGKSNIWCSKSAVRGKTDKAVRADSEQQEKEGRLDELEKQPNDQSKIIIF